MGLRVKQAVGIELAVDFDQRLTQPAQKRDADRLIVDIGAAAAVGRDDPAQHQRIFDLQPLLTHQRYGGVVVGQVELGGDRGLIAAVADQRAVAAASQRQPQRIQQDGLAGAGLAGQHA